MGGNNKSINLVVAEEKLSGMIHTLRGVPVMLDRDLAALYDVKPIRLREQMNRNSKRFPKDFVFQLTDTEMDHMVSQNAIPSRKHLGGSLPFTQDLKKHNAQYPPIAIKRFPYSHDRFLILDGETVYHLGASLKDLGKKWFAFSKMDKAGLVVMEKVEEVLGYGG